MKTENILKADLLDILFENRNKNYGAYVLRKYYHERLYKALGITFLFISLLSAYIYLYKPNIILTQVYTIPETTVLPPTTKKETPKPPETPKDRPVQKLLKSQLWISTIKIVDSTDKTVKLAKTLDNVVIASFTNDGPENNKQPVKFVVGNEPVQGNTNIVAKTINRDNPQATADVMPSFPGGTEALIRFLRKNLQNPEDLPDDKTISVKIMFIVGYDGVLKGFQTIEDGGPAFNNEVIRVLKKMPAWIPGKTAGENVSVYYTIPVKFVPQE